jgi:hypothetical protein
MKPKSHFLNLYGNHNEASKAKKLVVKWLHCQLTSKTPQLARQHLLGFYLLEPYKADNVTIRLHYWPAKQAYFPPCEEEMHDHIWSLDSYVLIGGLNNVEVDIQESPSGPWQVSIIKKIDNRESIQINPKRYKITNETRTFQKAGSRYQISPGIFHKTEVAPGQAVVTLVRSEPLLTRPSRGLVPAGTQPYAASKGICSPAASKRIMKEIIELLNDPNGTLES